jgi:hypothetical protein
MNNETKQEEAVLEATATNDIAETVADKGPFEESMEVAMEPLRRKAEAMDRARNAVNAAAGPSALTRVKGLLGGLFKTAASAVITALLALIILVGLAYQAASTGTTDPSFARLAAVEARVENHERRLTGLETWATAQDERQGSFWGRVFRGPAKPEKPTLP